MDSLVICQEHTGYEALQLKSRQESSCTVSTHESSSSSSTDQSIDSANPHHTTLVTGQYSDIYHYYSIRPHVIGTGNYGVVRECVRRATGERFAVKTIDKSRIGRLDHLQREVQLLQRINHPSIMKMVDVFEDADYVYIVTEKYTGGELFDKIVERTTSTGCMSEFEAAKIIKSILEAVLYLHSNGCVHRDIKPENILFESKKKGSPVKLIDFGLSRMHNPAMEGPMTNPVGTAYYMSPEVINGSYDKSCDLWSIGVMAYILLAGYPPFNGSGNDEIYAATLRNDLIFERKVWSGYSRTSRDFIRRLLCRDSSLRFTAEEALRHPWILSQCN